MAQTMPCPACKQTVSMQAAACPNCGHPIGQEDVKRHNTNMRNKGIFVIIIAVAVIMYMFSGGPKKSDLPHAMSYQIVSQGNSTPGGRARAEATIIAPTAESRDQFAQTAMQAAQDLQDKTRAKVVSILLEPDISVAGHGAALAIARYSPDGGGYSGKQGWTWQVESADKRPSAQAVQIDALWFANRNKFQVPDGSGGTMTNEDALALAIAEHLGISVDNVHLLYSERKKYLDK